jgi:head-tail adaptor
MTAGLMRDQVTFTSIGRVLRADGGYDTTPAVSSAVWAAVKPVRATETEQAGRLQGSTTYMITIYADDLPAGASSDYTVTWTTRSRGSIDMNIREIREAPENDLHLIIMAEAGTVL